MGSAFSCLPCGEKLSPLDLEKQKMTENLAIKGLDTHGFKIQGEVPKSPTKDPWLWDFFHKKGPQLEKLSTENRCFTGYKHEELDFKKPIHAILVDFKADGMQMGMLIERLVSSGEQFVFIGNPLPFNEGWHFTAVNDFEDEAEQMKLNPGWKDIRIWHRVNYVPILKGGKPALVPKEVYQDKDKEAMEASGILVDEKFKMSHIYCLGGLMAGTLIANVVKDGTPANAFVEKQMSLNTVFATVGHGLGVLVGTVPGGRRKESCFKGFTAAILQDQNHLMKISGMTGVSDPVCEYKHSSGCKLVSASSWGRNTCEQWFGKLGLQKRGGKPTDAVRTFTRKSQDIVFKLDFAKHMPTPSPTKKHVAFFVDYRFDPVEALAAVLEFEKNGITYEFISHSTAPGEKLEGNNVRPIESELVFGNAFYALHDCCFTAPTTPADKVSKETKFDAFAVAGGQGPFHMIGDKNIISIIDRVQASGGVGSAICHGPMVLIGSKYIDPTKSGPKVTSFNGAWIYFRDVLDRFVTEKPGHIEKAPEHSLITGNSPAGAKAWSLALCEMILKPRDESLLTEVESIVERIVG